MLQAANTGHRGLLTTLHAGGPAQVPARLEAMALSAPGSMLEVVRRLIAGGIEAVVHLERVAGARRVVSVAELAPRPDGRMEAVELRKLGPDGVLVPTGHVPAWAGLLGKAAPGLGGAP